MHTLTCSGRSEGGSILSVLLRCSTKVYLPVRPVKSEWIIFLQFGNIPKINLRSTVTRSRTIDFKTIFMH